MEACSPRCDSNDCLIHVQLHKFRARVDQFFARYVHLFDDGNILEWADLFDDTATMQVGDQLITGRSEIYHFMSRTSALDQTVKRHLIGNLEIVGTKPLSVVVDYQLLERNTTEIRIIRSGRYHSTFVTEPEGLRLLEHRAVKW